MNKTQDAYDHLLKMEAEKEAIMPKDLKMATYDQKRNVDDANLKINNARSDLYRLIEADLPEFLKFSH